MHYKLHRKWQSLNIRVVSCLILSLNFLQFQRYCCKNNPRNDIKRTQVEDDYLLPQNYSKCDTTNWYERLDKQIFDSNKLLAQSEKVNDYICIDV